MMNDPLSIGLERIGQPGWNIFCPHPLRIEVREWLSSPHEKTGGLLAEGQTLAHVVMVNG
jgi:hypothetical protein